LLTTGFTVTDIQNFTRTAKKTYRCSSVVQRVNQ